MRLTLIPEGSLGVAWWRDRERSLDRGKTCRKIGGNRELRKTSNGWNGESSESGQMRLKSWGSPALKVLKELHYFWKMSPCSDRWRSWRRDQTSTGNVTGADLAGTDEPEEGLEDDIMFGDFDFCVRPKEEKCILFKVLSFMRHTVWCNLSGQLVWKR